LLTTKGDVPVHNGTTVVREATGANDSFLMANSGQTTGREWVTVQTLLGKLLTTKGDLISYSTTPVRVGVGTTGTSLVADSGQTTGQLWGRGWKGARSKTLTSGVATGLFEVALPTETDCGGQLTIRVRVRDASNETQTLVSRVGFVAYNKGGVYGTQMGTEDQTSVVSAGTLTSTLSIASGTDKITVQLTATTSLTATLLEVQYVLDELSGQAVTFL
jgi:hypothetical protein